MRSHRSVPQGGTGVEGGEGRARGRPKPDPSVVFEEGSREGWLPRLRLDETAGVGRGVCSPRRNPRRKRQPVVRDERSRRSIGLACRVLESLRLDVVGVDVQVCLPAYERLDDAVLARAHCAPPPGERVARRAERNPAPIRRSRRSPSIGSETVLTASERSYAWRKVSRSGHRARGDISFEHSSMTIRELRAAWSGLRATPGATCVAVLTCALGAHRSAEHLLFGVPSSDVASHAGASAAVMLAVIAATTVPAWRASRVDAAAVLRSE